MDSRDSLDKVLHPFPVCDLRQVIKHGQASASQFTMGMMFPAANSSTDTCQERLGISRICVIVSIIHNMKHVCKLSKLWELLDKSIKLNQSSPFFLKKIGGEIELLGGRKQQSRADGDILLP